MSITQKPGRNVIPAPVPNENVLLAIIAVGFCLLHMLTAARFMPPAAARTAAPSLEQMLADRD